MKKIFVAMSGGVDSSVAAFLLKEQGYDVTGVFMRCYNLDGCAERDAEDARRVAEKLEMPFYVWDFEEEYKRKVVDYMVAGYKRGETPNPDVMCNREIKFGIFYDRALAAGADFVATGHYVSLKNGALYAAKDKNKDQSYFLWTLTQKKLEHCLFPIGDYVKSEVREMARKAGLPTAEKKDSQGICFLGNVTLADFLAAYIPERSGAVLTANGEKVGEHRGAEFYTIGQRHLGIKNQESGIKGRHETKPHYVAEKNITENTLTVAEGSDHPSLYKKEIELIDVNVISRDLESDLRNPVLARVRYRQPLAEATLYFEKTAPFDSSTRLTASELRVRLIFDQPQKFVAKGQSAVFYMKDPSAGSGRNPSQDSEFRMLGGGVIG